MSKSIIITLFSTLFSLNAYADAYPTDRYEDKVYIILKNDTGINGYTDLVNYSYDHRPVTKPFPKGSELLPLVLETTSRLIPCG